MAALPSPDEVVVQMLAAVAELSLVAAPAAGANLFRGKVRPPGARIPARAVFCLSDGILESRPMCGGRKRWRVYAVQVRVRVPPDQWGTGQALAEACVAALDTKVPPGCTFSHVGPPGAVPIGDDDNGFPEWSLPVVRIGREEDVTG